MTTKTFSRTKTYDELAAECERRGWARDSSQHDNPKVASDYVCVKFTAEDKTGTMLVSMVNGRFFGDLEDGTHFTSDKNTHDNEAWFKELLEAVYV